MHLIIRFLFFFLCLNPLLNLINGKSGKNSSTHKTQKRKRRNLKTRYNRKAAKQGKAIIAEFKTQIVDALKKVNSDNVSDVADIIKNVIKKEINSCFDILDSTYVNKKTNESDAFYYDIFNRAIEQILNENKMYFEINQQRKLIGDILSYDKNKKEIVLKYNDTNQEEKNIIIFNKDDIKNLIDGIKNKKNKEVLQIVLQKIQEGDIEGSTEFKIEGSTIIDGENKEIVSAEQLEEITRGNNFSIEIGQGTKIEINGKKIQEDNIYNKLKILIEKENDIKSNFLDYLVKSINYFSPYIQGELNMWAIMYFLNESDFTIIGNDIKHIASDKIVLKKFIVDDDKNTYNFKELCDFFKKCIASIDGNTSDGNTSDGNTSPSSITDMSKKILEIHNRQKLFGAAPLDYKILCIWYDMFIIEAILAQEDNENKRLYRNKIYQLISPILISEQSTLFGNLLNKIIKQFEVFSQYNSLMDVLEKKHFYFQSDFEMEATDLREDKIFVLNTDFNLSLMVLLYMKINSVEKEDISDFSTDDIYHQIKYTDYTDNIKKMQNKQTSIITEIQEELKKLLEDKKRNIDGEKNDDKKKNMQENYKKVSENVLQYGPKIPLQKKPTNPEQAKQYAQIVDSSKFTRHLRNAYVLIFYKNNHDIYEEELAGLFKKNEFLDVLLNSEDDKLIFLNDYEAYKKDKNDFNQLQKRYFEYKKKNTEELTPDEANDIMEFEKRNEAYNYYKILEEKSIEIDETAKIGLFLSTVIVGYNENEFFDINRLYYLIVQATNSTFYIDDTVKTVNSKFPNFSYIKEYIKSIKKLNSLYIKFLFYKLNVQVIKHLDPKMVTKSSINKIWAWTVGSVGGVLGTLGAAWMTGNLPALGGLLSSVGGGVVSGISTLAASATPLIFTPAGFAITTALVTGGLIYKNVDAIKNNLSNTIDKLKLWGNNLLSGQEELKLD